MPLATPTITLTAANGSITVAINNGGSTIDHNEVWRRTAGEYSGAAILITQTVGQDGSWIDAQVASGVSYDYYVVAVDGSSNRATSAVSSATLTLSEGALSSVLPKDATGLIPTVTSDTDIAQTRDYNRASHLYSLATAVLPVISISQISSTMVSTVCRLKASTMVAVRTLFRTIRDSRYYVCLRDVFGNKWFGYLSAYSEAYDYGFMDIKITLTVTDYTEAL